MLNRSLAHELAKFAQQDETNLLEALNDPQYYGNMEVYNTTKLLQVFMTREMAGLSRASNIIVNAVTPGLCKTHLRRDFPKFLDL